LRLLDTCVISCGGKGTRLREVTGTIPKPLYPIRGISCFERSIFQLKEIGIKKFYILTSYKSNLFREEIKKFRKIYEVEINIFEEKKPLGECGGLWIIKEQMNSTFLFLNADLIWKVDIQKLADFHFDHASDVTFLTHLSTHPEDSDVILESPTKEIKDFSLKPHIKNNKFKFMILGNAGIALINPYILDLLPAPTKKDSLCHYLLKNKSSYNLRIFSYNTSEYVKDMGTPKRLVEVKNAIDAGIVEKKSYLNKQKSLFIDRDNTLINCKKNEYITSVDQINLIKKNINKISQISKNFDLVIMVTNQPQISMGLIKWQEVIEINNYVIQLCLHHDLFIDDFVLCPHHPHMGFENEIANLKQSCFCRKPSPGMFFQERFKKNIDLSKSLMIGDSDNDKLAALRAGTDYISVDTFN